MQPFRIYCPDAQSAEAIEKLVADGRMYTVGRAVEVVVLDRSVDDNGTTYPPDRHSGRPPQPLCGTDPEGWRHNFTGSAHAARILSASESAILRSARSGEPVTRGPAQGWTFSPL